MADEPGEKPEGEAEGEVLELTEEHKAPEEGQDQHEATEGDDEEVIISIGEQGISPAPGEDNVTIRQMRERIDALARENRELKGSPDSKVTKLGPKPTLEACDYDEERFDRELDAWHDTRRQVETERSEAEKAQESVKRAFEADLGAYAEQKDKLPVKDFDTAEAAVLQEFNETQQALLIQAAEEKALLVYALGNSPEKRKELAAIKDPIKFVAALIRLEGKTSMQRRPRTQPEGRVTGSAPLTGSTDKTLERLEKEASKPGADRSALIRYKREKGLL